MIRGWMSERRSPHRYCLPISVAQGGIAGFYADRLTVGQKDIQE
jgi:hypothetical protein